MAEAQAVKRTGIVASAAAVIALASVVASHWEGKRNVPYRDIVGVLTVCYGETHGVQDRTYSDAECKAMLDAGLSEADRAVRQCIHVDMPITVEAALVDLTYNVGPSAVCGSTIQKLALAGDWQGVCDQLPRWNKAGGEAVHGLSNRRADDRALCMNGVGE